MTDLTLEERKVRALEAIAGALIEIAEQRGAGEEPEPDTEPGIRTLGDGVVRS